MRMLWMCLLSGALATAQSGPLSPGESLRVIDVRQGSAETIIRSLESVFPGIARVDNQLIARGRPAVLDMVEEAVRKLDLPAPEASAAPNVELTVRVLRASTQELPDAKVSGEVEATVGDLRARFAYKSYKELDTVVIRSRSGTATGRNPYVQHSAYIDGKQFSFVAWVRVESGPAPRTIHLTVQEASLYGARTRGDIQVELDLRDGQVKIAGKTSFPDSDDAAFLVISARVIE